MAKKSDRGGIPFHEASTPGHSVAAEVGMPEYFTGRQLSQLHGLHQALQRHGALSDLTIEYRHKMCRATFMLTNFLEMGRIPRVVFTETKMSNGEYSYEVALSVNGIDEGDRHVSLTSKRSELDSALVKFMRDAVLRLNREGFEAEREKPVIGGVTKIRSIREPF